MGHQFHLGVCQNLAVWLKLVDLMLVDLTLAGLTLAGLMQGGPQSVGDLRLDGPLRGDGLMQGEVRCPQLPVFWMQWQVFPSKLSLQLMKMIIKS